MQELQTHELDAVSAGLAIYTPPPPAPTIDPNVLGQAGAPTPGTYEDPNPVERF